MKVTELFLYSIIPFILLVGGFWYGFFMKSQRAQGEKFRQVVGTLSLLTGLAILIYAPRGGIVWMPYSEEALIAGVSEGRPTILDFYADWCIPCHQLDEYTYSDERVGQALTSYHKLKVDVTDQGGPQVQKVLEKFNIQGVPTVIFLNSKGEEIPRTRLAGFVSAEDFLGLLKRIKS